MYIIWEDFADHFVLTPKYDILLSRAGMKYSPCQVHTFPKVVTMAISNELAA